MLLKSSPASSMPMLEEELRNEEEEENDDNVDTKTKNLLSKHKLILQSPQRLPALNTSITRSQSTQETVSMSSVKLASLSVIRARYCKRQRNKCNKQKNSRSSSNNKNAKSSCLLYLHTRTGLLTPSAPPCFGGNNFVETFIEMIGPIKHINDDNISNTNNEAKSIKEKERCTSLDTCELVSTNTNAQLQLGRKRTRCDGHVNVRYERV